MPRTKATFSLAIVLASLMLCCVGQASAAFGKVTSTVQRVLIAGDSTFGGCMVMLNVDPQGVLGDCGSAFVSFSCSGDYADPVRAYRMVDQAQLALATGKKIQVFFRDDQKHNGYCVATRVDIIR